MRTDQITKKTDGLSGLLENALIKRRRTVVYALARRLYARIDSAGLLTVESPSGLDQWAQIESLSQLRSVVGGRFQKLKERWTGAGFPLRLHRGDRSLGASVNEAGWRELSIWLDKQGFESRLSGSGGSVLFEIRAKTMQNGTM